VQQTAGVPNKPRASVSFRLTAHGLLHNQFQYLMFFLTRSQRPIRQANSYVLKLSSLEKRNYLQVNALILTKLSAYISHLFLQGAKLEKTYINLTTQF
jgi:hypothetical protein